MIPVIGGITLVRHPAASLARCRAPLNVLWAQAAVGAAAAVSLTTRSDETGNAARATGTAVVYSVEKLQKTKLLSTVGGAATATAVKLKGSVSARLAKDEPPAPAPEPPTWWWKRLRTRCGLDEETGPADRLAKYAKCTSDDDCLVEMLRELAHEPPAQRAKAAQKLVRDFDPDKHAGSFGARATAKALTAHATALVAFLDRVGWDSLETSPSLEALVAQVHDQQHAAAAAAA
ncbi:hypothetical protein M885DRAFT_510976 [Pelagophyceae sp. CCMP2097]|nr:hypothetical protein M885DRAFT_510976 [Pelagophyceae sp. CCMP2097]